MIVTVNFQANRRKCRRLLNTSTFSISQVKPTHTDSTPVRNRSPEMPRPILQRNYWEAILNYFWCSISTLAFSSAHTNVPTNACEKQRVNSDSCRRAVGNPLNTELIPICHLLALLGTHHILHVSRLKTPS